MASSTGFILAAAAITAANEAVFVPLAKGQNSFAPLNWRIIPAAGVAAIALAGLDQISPTLGTGLAVLALVIAVVVPFGNAPSPIENLSKVMGLKTA